LQAHLICTVAQCVVLSHNTSTEFSYPVFTFHIGQNNHEWNFKHVFIKIFTSEKNKLDQL